jgi:hypothetical protein
MTTARLPAAAAMPTDADDDAQRGGRDIQARKTR